MIAVKLIEKDLLDKARKISSLPVPERNELLKSSLTEDSKIEVLEKLLVRSIIEGDLKLAQEIAELLNDELTIEELKKVAARCVNESTLSIVWTLVKSLSLSEPLRTLLIEEVLVNCVKVGLFNAVEEVVEYLPQHLKKEYLEILNTLK
jgi:hypothetical protein